MEWIKEMLQHSFVLHLPETYHETMLHIESLIAEHLDRPASSELKALVPSIGAFFTSLPLGRAFEEYDRKYAISSRRFVGPAFNEIRHILNLAQVMAIGPTLKLITFDGDQTLYSDGGNFAQDSELAGGIINLLSAGVHVAVVTAAGYGLDGPKYEVRLAGLLRAIEVAGLDAETASRLLVLGGECNYLLRCVLRPGSPGREHGTAALEPVPAEEWQGEELTGPKPLLWDEKEVKSLLDIAQESMEQSVTELRLRARIIRKPRGIGMIPGGDDSVERLNTTAVEGLETRLRLGLEQLKMTWQVSVVRSRGDSSSFNLLLWIDPIGETDEPTLMARPMDPTLSEACQWATAARSSSERLSMRWCCG